jgi:hypothetical protein
VHWAHVGVGGDEEEDEEALGDVGSGLLSVVGGGEDSSAMVAEDG